MKHFDNAVTKPSHLAEITPFINARIGNISDVFTHWRTSLPNINFVVNDVLSQIDFSSQSKSVIMAAAELASEELTNPYHNNDHLLEVFSVALTLGNYSFKNGNISEENFANILTAALIHDYKHDGTGNSGEQFRLEAIAVNGAKDKLIQAGLSAKNFEIVEALVLATDVSRDFSDSNALSPADTIKLYKSDAIESVHTRLSILQERHLIEEALILLDSDIASNFMSKDLMDINSKNVASESGADNNKGFQQFFIDNICGGKFHSDVGVRLLSSSFTRINSYVSGKPSEASL